MVNLDTLHRYLQYPREFIRAGLIESGDSPAPKDYLDFEVEVVLPQRPVAKVNSVEQIRVAFRTEFECPDVYLLREDFPNVPHLVRSHSDQPKQICLYERSWMEEMSSWAPGPFVERIRAWLSGTADGTLHRQDQPLEPLLPPTRHRLILPPQEEGLWKGCSLRSFFIECRHEPNGPYFLLCYDQAPPWIKSPRFPVIFLAGPIATHGLIHRQPRNLLELEDLLGRLGGSLVECIAQAFHQKKVDLSKLSNDDQKLIIVVQLPKRREAEGEIESFEYQAFVLDTSPQELLKIETIHEPTSGGPILVPRQVARIRNKELLSTTRLEPTSVQFRLSQSTAANSNGVESRPMRVTAIGLGALGSQVVNNLWRGGFGEWTLIDDDILEPHNVARHLLCSDAVGLSKVQAMSQFMSLTLIDEKPSAALRCNYLMPSGEAKESLNRVLTNSELILDLSASVAVGRQLALDRNSEARRVSAFLNSRGDELVILTESVDRSIDLIWLEAEYLRSIAFDDRLEGHLDSMNAVAHRYGNACREISAVFRQDLAATFAGIAASRIRVQSKKPTASISIHRYRDADASLSSVVVSLSKPIVSNIQEWRILLHEDVLRSVHEYRAEKLAQETGGILLGVVDRFRKYVAIVGLLSAPDDSIEWPTSFIRGANGLSEIVSQISQKTLTNLVYVGEWHTHPKNHSAKPSRTDKEAVDLLTPHMEADGQPTLMLIAGERGDTRILVRFSGVARQFEVKLPSITES